MDKHHFRLGWIFIGIGLLGGCIMLVTVPMIVEQLKEINSYFGDAELTTFQTILLILIPAIPLLAIIGGTLHYMQHALASPILLVTSCIFLFSFPIGTAVAVYYFWYRFSYLKNQELKVGVNEWTS